MIVALKDVAAVVTQSLLAELSRRREGPARAAARFRARGLRRRPRSARSSAQLRWLIDAVDRRLPGGSNCYRRALVEMALDRTAAQQPLHMGLVRGGGSASGHAWLGDRREPEARYDVELAL